MTIIDKVGLLLIGSSLVFGAINCKKAATVALPAPLGASTAADQDQASTEEINPRLLRRFQPIGGGGPETARSAERIALGRSLFYDKRLSGSQDIACNDCHALDKFGIDGKVTATGANGQRGARNTPTVFNAATHVAQFWDGRADTIESQATGPIMNPIEMGMPNERAVVGMLKSIPGYVKMFERAFAGEKDPVSLKNLGEAIGAFERGLITTSRWDKFVAGDAAALTATEKKGLRVFLDVGCMACHTGPQVGGSMFQKVGAAVPWPNQKDVGRVGITKAPADRMVFKVPTLKNIAKTSPYFHDGSAATLEDAVNQMAKYQLGITLLDEETKAITSWMLSMTGEVDPAYIARPALPPNGPTTPQPSRARQLADRSARQ